MTVPRLVATAEPSDSDGPLLVLGPSLGSAVSVLWEDAIPILGERFRLVSWDLPGHGRGTPTTEPFTVEELADGVAVILDELGARRAYVAGVSIGGAASLAFALRHPDRALAVGVVCSAARIGTEELWAERAALVRSSSTSPLVVPSAQRWFAPGGVERHPDVVGRLLHALQDADDESYALACDALRVFDIRDRLGEIAVPVLAVWAEHDASTPRERLEEIAAGVQRGRAVGIPDAAHLPTVDQPELVARELLSFFGSAEVSGRIPQHSTEISASGGAA